MTRLVQPSSNARGELIRAENFILATRDTGYRSAAYALAELVDNAIQAGASTVETRISAVAGEPTPLQITVTDNGAGMSPAELRQALAFGGSSRFNDRTSLGRYGMGLPNGSLSLARRFTVSSWQPGSAHSAFLDVDEVVARRQRFIPKPVPTPPPDGSHASPSGTSVHLTKCDRVTYRRAGSMATRLRADFGRIFRAFILSGLNLTVNGEPVRATDPMFLDGRTEHAAGRRFGEDLEYTVEAPSGQQGTIKIRFVELPIERWSGLSSKDKRALGITNSPSCSVMRAGREIDRGWFFTGGKRRENYDDWWRYEISFTPELDELFGITHAKQQIAPRPELEAILSPDVEAIARALNTRVRKRFESNKRSALLSEAEQKAAKAHAGLPPLPAGVAGRRTKGARSAIEVADEAPESPAPYRILVGSIDTTDAYEVLVRRGQLTLVLNDRHPFFRDLYEPLSTAAAAETNNSATFLALTMLAAARAEASVVGSSNRSDLIEFRRCWSDVLATFFNA